VLTEASVAELDSEIVPELAPVGRLCPQPGRSQTDRSADEATTAQFELAVHEHSGRLMVVARAIVGNRACAEDVVQQALTNLYQHRRRYDWREPGGLLRRAVVNQAVRVLRRKKEAPLAGDFAGRGHSPVGGMIRRETAEKVREAIERLPDHFRAALVLCEYENLSYREIADELDASVPQIKTWIHRARRKLAVMLDDFIQPGWNA
jgi:RNA polymerase sigma factor (sigma-70 family)